jgi:Protein of unknown function (DUF2934)
MPKTTEVSSPARRKSKSAKKHLTPEEIQLRAYEIYLERCGAPGNSLEDWVQAERELLQKYGLKSHKNGRTRQAA